jgi:hypothetical protein
MSETQLVPVPTPGSINTGVDGATVASLNHFLGVPHPPHPSSIVAKHLVTIDVGPFHLTGFDLFLYDLREALAELKRDRPWLYNALGTAGCYNCRYIAGTHTPSVHAYGLAVDLTIGGILTPQGSHLGPVGLIHLYQQFKAYSVRTGKWFYWGAGFGHDDPMHWEVSESWLVRMHGEGRL